MFFVLLHAFGLLTSLFPAAEKQIEVSNPLPFARHEEMVEIPVAQLGIPMPATGEAPGFILLDEAGRQVAYQLTYDSLFLFPASVGAHGKSTYRLKNGTPRPFKEQVRGRVYPERMDDLAWENDKAAYRAYGPALERSGERAFGYDVLNKSTDTLVLDGRYARQLDPVANARIRTLRQEGRSREADSLARAISYHVDHGNGMDCYSVGPTLGGGTAALMKDDSTLVYPYSYERCEILDNGPLRFTARLTYRPFALNGDTAVVETRLIRLDRGSHLNRTEVTYRNLTQVTPVAAGIVVHRQNPDGYVLDSDKGYVAYADSTDNPRAGNGVIHLGLLFPDRTARLRTLPYAGPPSVATAHALGIVPYRPGQAFVYYWGSSWSKSGWADTEAWCKYLETYGECLRHPLRTTVR